MQGNTIVIQRLVTGWALLKWSTVACVDDPAPGAPRVAAHVAGAQLQCMNRFQFRQSRVNISHGSPSVIEIQAKDQLAAARRAEVRSVGFRVVAGQTTLEFHASIIRTPTVRQAAALRAPFIQAADLVQLLEALQAQG